MKKIFFIIFSFFFCFYIKSADNEITIFFTNDTNGHPLSFNSGEGGAAARASLIKQIVREKKISNGSYLILDAGGIIRGRAESNLFNGLPDIAGMNSTGYFASGVGASELFDGVKNFINLNDKAKFYFISSNLIAVNQKNTEITDKYAIKKIGNLRIGIFSVITEEILKEIPEESRKDFAISNPIDAARQIVKELRSEKNKVDIIIALTHLGYYPEDSNVGSRYLAASVPGIDIILDGRTGIKLESAVDLNGTKIFQGYKWGLYLGEINLQVTGNKIADLKYTLHPVNAKDQNGKLIDAKINENFIVKAAVKSKMPGLDGLLNKKIVKLDKGVKFDTKDINKKENEIGNFICDALLDYTKADIAFQNAGGISEEVIEGVITRKSFDNIIKFDNPVMVCSLKGSDLIRVLEYSLQSAGTGAFLQLSGIKLTFSRSQNKITKIEVNGSPVVDNKFYSIALNFWLAEGNDGYELFREIPYKINYNIIHREVLYDYIEKNKAFSPSLHERINFID